MNKPKKFNKQKMAELKALFLKYEDPIGVEFGKEALGSFTDLQRFLTFKWFNEAWELWQTELRAIIKSRALQRIQEISQEGSAQSLNAAKYLANGEYIEGTGSKRGRPTKEEVTGELKRQVKAIDVLDEDFKRMTGLPTKWLAGETPVTVVQGGKK
jgi:hypothetical protein